MANNLNYNELRLYLCKKVLVAFSNGSTATGTLMSIDPERGEILVEDKTYPLEDVLDIEMIGTATYRTYIEDPASVCDIDGLPFGLCDFLEGVDHTPILHDEFDCLASCHLTLSDDKICAKDVRFLSLSHKVYLPSLSRLLYLYMLDDGNIVIGTLQEVDGGYAVRTADGTQHAIDMTRVADVIRMPLTNEYVLIEKKDGSVVSGTVSAANASMIVVVGEIAQMVNPCDILSIRYKGIIVTGVATLAQGKLKQINLSLGVNNETFLCKRPYFHSKEDEEAASAGSRAIFTPGVTARGLIAKDVEVEGITKEAEENFKTGIILVTPNKLNLYGFIGAEFVSKSYSLLTRTTMPRGTVTFTGDQITFPINSHNVYVVRYLCREGAVLHKATKIELIDMYPKAEYAKVWIDGDGQIRKMPLSVAYLDRVIGQEVDVLTSAGETVFGTIAATNETEVTLRRGQDTAVIKKEDISQIFFYGTVTDYQSNGTGFINGYFWFHINSFMDTEIQQRGVRLGSRVKFTLETSPKGNGTTAAGIELLSEPAENETFPTLESFNNRGYLIKYVMGTGYVLTPEQLEEHLQSENRRATKCQLSFKQMRLVNPSEFEIDTIDHYYLISYDRNARGTLVNVKILKELSYQKTDTTIEIHADAINLADLSDENSVLKGQNYEYGLINYHSSHYALINRHFFNSAYVSSPSYDPENSVCFNPEKAKVAFDFKMKTGKYSYLVRFVRKGTVLLPASNIERPTIDYSCPIEVVSTFAKKEYKSIVIQDDRLLLEGLDPTVSSPIPRIREEDEEDDAPALMIGESVYVKHVNGSSLVRIFSGETEEEIIFSTGETVQKSSIAELYRFGVVSAISLSGGTATINNTFDFRLTRAELKMVNILKNQKELVRLHVMYRCENGKVVAVSRVSDECLNAISWSTGIVTDCDENGHNIIVDSSTVHYLSVMSDDVNSYANNGSILDREVFVKRVFQPYLDEKEAEPRIVPMAISVRCQEEDLTIQYDNGRDIYYGYRNTTRFFPIFGSSHLLESKIGETLRIPFRLSTDQITLEAYFEGYDDTETDTEGSDDLARTQTLDGIQDEPLSLLLLQKEEVSQLLIGKVLLDDDGIPQSEEQAQRAMDILTGQGKPLAAAKLAIALPAYKLQGDKGQLIMNELRRRSTAIVLDANSGYGECAYYLTTLSNYASPKKRTPHFSNYDYLFQLFLQDFDSRDAMVRAVQSSQTADKARLAILFNKPCLQVKEFLAHIVALSPVNFDIVSSLIQKNALLSTAIATCAKEIDNTITAGNIAELLHALKERYLRDKFRFSNQIFGLLENRAASQRLKELLGHMQSRFLHLITKEDRQRFDRLFNICNDVGNYTNQAGFVAQEAVLQNAYKELCALEEEIKSHPCRESVEMLLSNKTVDLSSNILATLKAEVDFLLNQLYQTVSMPEITCSINEENGIEVGTGSFWLLVKNGEARGNLQPAENLSIELESFTEGVSVDSTVRLPASRLFCGEPAMVKVNIVTDGFTTGAVEIGWTAKFEYTSAFAGGTPVRTVVQQEADAPIPFQITTFASYEKNYDVKNPYKDPAKGKPLDAGDAMFFGREVESRTIRDSIIRAAEDGEEFIPGSAVIIHGQKKSGKTSLVNQIKNYIRESKTLANKAIMLNFGNFLDETGGAELLPTFKRAFYSIIISRFEDEVINNHPDVVTMLKENGLEIPDPMFMSNLELWPVVFDKFFRDFARIDKGCHNIVLFMDEFTLWCTTLLDEIQNTPSLKSIPTFIKTFSQYGFVQIIIGHESMMRALDTLGVFNHTAEFAKTVEIAALDEASSRQLIIEPMKTVFGYDVYETALGKQAVEDVLDLSGRSPTYLMKLCDKIFDYYTDKDKCPDTQLVRADVAKAVQEYTGELLLSDFDILMLEDGDDPAEAEQRIIYHFLKTAALLSVSAYDKRTADSGEITRELVRNYNHSVEEIERTRNILEARRVISITGGGRVKINTGLFKEFVVQKNGAR